MNYKDTKKAMMNAYPSLFANEVDVLHDLFFLVGNGYAWKNGELTDGSKSVAAAIKLAMNDNRNFIKQQIKYQLESLPFRTNDSNLIKEFNDNQLKHFTASLKETYNKNYAKNERRREVKRRIKAINEGFADGCWFFNKDGSVGCVLYSLSQYAKILHVPQNVKPDWLRAAKKALLMTKTMRKTPEDVKWLNIARDHLRALDKGGTLYRAPAFF